MGGSYTKPNAPKARRFLLLGLDGSGKTTILYQLKLGDKIDTTPTLGFNVEQITFNGLPLSVWDVGGGSKVRSLWHHYYKTSVAVIFVVDSTDVKRMAEGARSAKSELQSLLQEEELKTAALLVLANKQDVPGALSVEQITDLLELRPICGRPWFIQGTTATNGSGLQDGFQWLTATLLKTHRRTSIISTLDPRSASKPNHNGSGNVNHSRTASNGGLNSSGNGHSSSTSNSNSNNNSNNNSFAKGSSLSSTPDIVSSSSTAATVTALTLSPASSSSSSSAAANDDDVTLELTGGSCERTVQPLPVLSEVAGGDTHTKKRPSGGCQCFG